MLYQTSLSVVSSSLPPTWFYHFRPPALSLKTSSLIDWIWLSLIGHTGRLTSSRFLLFVPLPSLGLQIYRWLFTWVLGTRCSGPCTDTSGTWDWWGGGVISECMTEGNYMHCPSPKTLVQQKELGLPESLPNPCLNVTGTTLYGPSAGICSSMSLLEDVVS